MSTSLDPEIQEFLTEQETVRTLVARLDKILPPGAQISLEDALPLIAKESRATINLIASYRVAESLRGIRREHVRQLEKAAEQAAAAERAKAESEARAAQDKENETKGILSNVAHGSMNKKNGGIWQGCKCQWCEEGREDERVHEEAMNAIFARYENSLKIKWTNELLDSSFAMPDGTLVLWGDATVEQHTARMVMLKHNVRANAEAAARHQRAISLLEESGAHDLRKALTE